MGTSEAQEKPQALGEFNLSALRAVEAHKDLSEIDRSFRELKDLVESRSG
jgi:hypothetical protein